MSLRRVCHPVVQSPRRHRRAQDQGWCSSDSLKATLSQKQHPHRPKHRHRDQSIPLYFPLWPLLVCCRALRCHERLCLCHQHPGACRPNPAYSPRALGRVAILLPPLIPCSSVLPRIISPSYHRGQSGRAAVSGSQSGRAGVMAGESEFNSFHRPKQGGKGGTVQCLCREAPAVGAITTRWGRFGQKNCRRPFSSSS